jgi:hypothetical protein
MREQPHDWAEIYLCEYLETCEIFTLDLNPAGVKSGYPIDLRSQPQRSNYGASADVSAAGESKPSSLQIGPNLPICRTAASYAATGCLGGHWGPPPPARKTATPTGLVQEDRQPLPRIVEKTVSLYPIS